MKLNISDILAVTGGHLNTSIDTRSLSVGDIYVAINGDVHDGHDFINNAIKQGASCVVVDRDMGELSVPQNIVDDTAEAFQQIASYWRNQLSPKTIAVTGSCGKTTTRAFLENVFAQAGQTLASQGSFNNHIGVPLTLLRLKKEHEYFIAEVGTNHEGEIASLIPLVRPDVAIITNVGDSHLEGFGTRDRIAKEKADIYAGLSEFGTAIINADDHYADYWRDLNYGRDVVTFGMDHQADVQASNVVLDERSFASFDLSLPNTPVTRIQLNIMGRHNISNALAAAAAGYVLGLSVEQIAFGLQKTQPETRRLVETKLPMGATLIDDSYNANPLSTKAAMALLASRAKEKAVFVFGDMLEMGQEKIALHADIGRHAKSLGIPVFYGYGELAKEAVHAFGDQAEHFDDQEKLIQRLRKTVTPDQAVLIKGSNGMKMYQVVAALKEEGM